MEPMFGKDILFLLDGSPHRARYDALIPALEEVGARFERGDFFVPEMLIAGRAMAGSMEVLRPLLAETGIAPLLRRLHEHGIDFKSLQSSESSLEEIFVRLVREDA